MFLLWITNQKPIVKNSGSGWKIFCSQFVWIFDLIPILVLDCSLGSCLFLFHWSYFTLWVQIKHHRIPENSCKRIRYIVFIIEEQPTHPVPFNSSVCGKRGPKNSWREIQHRYCIEVFRFDLRHDKHSYGHSNIFNSDIARSNSRVMKSSHSLYKSHTSIQSYCRMLV